MPNSLSKDYSDSDSKTAVRICPFDSLRVASLIREKKKKKTKQVKLAHLHSFSLQLLLPIPVQAGLFVKPCSQPSH